MPKGVYVRRKKREERGNALTRKPVIKLMPPRLITKEEQKKREEEAIQQKEEREEIEHQKTLQNEVLAEVIVKEIFQRGLENTVLERITVKQAAEILFKPLDIQPSDDIEEIARKVKEGLDSNKFEVPKATPSRERLIPYQRHKEAKKFAELSNIQASPYKSTKGKTRGKNVKRPR